MAAMAAQQAPKKESARSTKPSVPGRKDEKRSLKQRLYDLPQAAGVAIMVLLLVVSLFVGNFRALQSATPKDFIRQGDVRSIVEDRIDAAENILTVAERAGLDADAIRAAEAAADMLEDAKTARDISRADQDLSAAVSRLTTAELSDAETARSMQRAADDFAEMGSFLRQEARDYNQKAEKAEKLYDRLPTGFLYEAPDRYEGV